MLQVKVSHLDFWIAQTDHSELLHKTSMKSQESLEDKSLSGKRLEKGIENEHGQNNLCTCVKSLKE